MIHFNLENEIYTHILQTGKDVNLIVMHPQTWQNLCQEVWSSESIAIYRHEASLKYKGIRVLRSLDMIDGLFEVK
jgi:hypothetical protein